MSIANILAQAQEVVQTAVLGAHHGWWQAALDERPLPNRYLRAAFEGINAAGQKLFPDDVSLISVPASLLLSMSIPLGVTCIVADELDDLRRDPTPVLDLLTEKLGLGEVVTTVVAVNHAIAHFER